MSCRALLLSSLALGFTVACNEDPDDNRPFARADAGTQEPADGGAQGNPDAAGEADAETFPDARTGLALLGYESHSADEVNLQELATGSLRKPRDLAFNPQMPDELWVVNRQDDSTITYTGITGDSPTAEKRIDPYALHFMEEVSSISFGAPGTFGTCQESRNTYNNQATANDFMGPSLWPSDMEIYAHSNPEAVDFLNFDLGSHIDMLHESPLCMGIEWDHDNVYWTFDGLTGSISRYDFQQDHGPGFDDHSDGIIRRYVIGEVLRVADVPSHMVLDHDTGLLYIADTGNARIAVLDTTQGNLGRSLRVKEPGTTLNEMTGVSTTTLVDGPGGELQQPSGIAMDGDLLYVSDYANSRISAFSKTTGARIDYLETGLEPNSLMGIELHQGALYFVDSNQNRLMKISAR